MGKKSKARASKPAGAAQAGASATTTVISGGNNKKQRCFSCLALLKDLAKAHQCPGCSDLYCWRCEKKSFEDCPNSELCVQPTKRCGCCIDGNFKFEVYMAACPYVDKEGKPFPKESYSDVFRQLCENESTYPNLDTMPLQQCRGDGCTVQECYRCFAAPDVRKLNSCSVCSLVRCSECIKMRPSEWGSDALEYFVGLAGLGVPFTESDISTTAAVLRKAEPETIGTCKDCGIGYCLSCMDDSNLLRCTLNGLYGVMNGMDKTKQFQCYGCYWSAKPCINPNCPNEDGTPTKRCGGCHIDRYCSIECQAEMYPEHMAKCKKIQAKRLASGMKVCAEGSAASKTQETSVNEEQEVKWDNNDYANAVGSAYKQEIGAASQKPWF